MNVIPRLIQRGGVVINNGESIYRHQEHAILETSAVVEVTL
jgi:hypothetical protein